MVSRMRPRLGTLFALALLAALAIPVPYIVTAPGPAFDTLGKVDGKEVVVISGTTTYPTTGSLDMTTVSEFGGARQGVSLWQALQAWVSPHKRVIPREAIYPDSVTTEQQKAHGAQQFSTSENDAIGAALTYLKVPVVKRAVVSEVRPDTPADGTIQAGDILLSVDGVAVASPDDVVAAIRAKPAGTALQILVARSGSQVTVSVVSGARQDDPATAENEQGTPFIGISVGTVVNAQFDVHIDLAGVAGPSAGTMFALAVIDKLTPGSLTGGKVVAGTGTIDANGNVGAIGGIAQKMVGAKNAGAVLFLAPMSNCSDVQGHVPSGMTVAAVSTLSDAVDAVSAFAAGKAVSGCAAK